MVSDIKELSTWIIALVTLAIIVAWTLWAFSKKRSDASEDTSLTKGG
jgi:hypothetical protein